MIRQGKDKPDQNSSEAQQHDLGAIQAHPLRFLSAWITIASAVTRPTVLLSRSNS
jgi:hypothetical protein